MTSIPMNTDYVDVKVKIGAVEYTNEELQIDSIKISNGCYDGSVFGVGNVYIKNANITMNYRGEIAKGLSMEIFFLHLEEWISFGKFLVTETPVISGEKISVSLESALGQTMSTSVVFETVLQEYTLRQIKTRLEETIGKQIVFIPALTSEEEKSFLDGKSACFLKDISNYVNQSPIDTGIAVRDMLSGLAILFGGNVYEDVRNRIVIKQKTYSVNSNKYLSSDCLDSNYKYSQETYAISTISLQYLPWSIGMFNPPNATERIYTVNYLGENPVKNLLLGGGEPETRYAFYDYVTRCDWIGWTNDGSKFDPEFAPGNRAMACLRQGGLYYKTCEMTFVGIDFNWNVSPGNLVKVKVPDLEDPIDVLCGEISYEWDGGFTTTISCNCNVESSGNYSTQVSTQAMAVAAQEGRQTSLELNYANITFSNIEDSTIRGSIFKDGTIEGSKIKDSTITGSLIADSTIKGSNIEEGTITGSLIKDGSITDSVFEDGVISGSKIADSAITESKISNSSITNSKIKDGEIENAKIKDSTLTGAKIKDATIGFEKVDTSFISDLTADEAYIENLKAEVAKIGYLTADEADIKFATITSLEAVDGKIDNLEAIAITTNNLNAKVAELGYLTADTAELAYAKIDLSNVGSQVVSSSMIIDGAVTNEKVANLSANKITSGTIDASKITVTNLNADNLTVGTINGQRIGAGSLSLDKLAEEVPTKEYLDSVEENLQGQIDGAIETFTKTEIPTLNNEPANAWTDDATRKKHIGDICYVINPTSSADGYCYRFADLGTNESPDYSWVLIKDSDVTKALQDIIDINGEITGIKQFDSEISSWKVDTDSELSSLKTRTESLETDLGDKVSSTVFNEVKQTVDENSASITTLSDTVKSKADGSTVEALTNTVNEVKQTADSNSSSISSMQTEISKKADGSTVTSLETRTSKLEQNLDGFKTEVSSTYTTKTDLDNLEVGGRNMCIGTNQGTKNWAWSMQTGTYTKEEVLEDGVRTCKMTRGDDTQSGWAVIHFNDIGRDKWLPDTDYIITVEVKSSVNATFRLHGLAAMDGTGNLSSKIDVVNNKTKAGEWVTLQWLCKTLNPLPTQTNQYLYMNNMNSEPGVYYQFRNLKIEKGNKATDWTPAPEDLENDSSAKADAALQSAKSYIDQTAESINQVVSKKVGDSEIISKINQSAEQITISADKLNLNGYLTISGADAKYDEKGSAEDKINKLEIGGANIFPNSTTLIGGGWTGTMADSNVSVGLSDPMGKHNAISMLGTATADNYRIIYNLIPEDGTYTLSLWAKSDKAVKIRNYHGDNKLIGEMNLTTEWKKFVFTKENYLKGDRVYFGGGSTWAKGVKLYIAYPKLEKGNKATDWTAAQSDISVKNIYTPNTTTIDGGKITTNSIKAKSIDVDNLFAQTITATGTIKGATLVGASISADKGTIGGFSVFKNWLVGFYDDSAYQYQVELNTDKTYSNEKNDVYAMHVQKINKSTENTDSEWYVTYNGYMHAEIGEIAGFTLQDKKLIANSEYTPENSAATYYYDAKINSKFNQEADFLTLTCTVNNNEVNKAVYGLDGVQLKSNGYDYYDKFVRLSDRSLAFGVNSGTPYNGNAIAFQIDSGYSAITSNGEFLIDPSCTINVPTTVNNHLSVSKIITGNEIVSKVGVELYHPNSTPYIDFHNSQYGQSSVDYDFRILSSKKNSLSFISNSNGNVFYIDGASVVENNYRVIGCTVTTSGNFTCKKYRDGRLIIECRSKTTSIIGMTNHDPSGIYYATGAGGTFPVAFTDTPSIACGLSVPDLACPFAHVTFDEISKTGYRRQIFWSSFSGNKLPVGTVVSATFTGRWK